MEHTEHNLEEMARVNEIEANVETTVEANGDLEAGFVDVTEGLVDTDTTTITEEVVTPLVAAKLSFADRAASMGLITIGVGTHHYSDQFSEVAYKNMKTMVAETGIADDVEVSHLAIFTKGIAANSEWKYLHPISDSYKFKGNADLINGIKDSINSIGNPELAERTFMTPNHAEIRHEIIIRNGNEIPEVGSVFPMLSISNTYNGTGASLVVFGMGIAETPDTLHTLSTERFGRLRQIHLHGATTELSAAVGEFVTIFNNGIQEVITGCFNKPVTPAEMTGFLDKIEAKVGKKRRDAIAVTLPNLEDQAVIDAWNMNSWQLFLALTRFTSLEKNINSKKLMESVVERVLVLPVQMADALKAING